MGDMADFINDNAFWADTGKDQCIKCGRRGVSTDPDTGLCSRCDVVPTPTYDGGDA